MFTLNDMLKVVDVRRFTLTAEVSTDDDLLDALRVFGGVRVRNIDIVGEDNHLMIEMDMRKEDAR